MKRTSRPGTPRVPAPTTPSADERRGQARAIELFHVVVMQVMSRHLRPDEYALKGGVNLRFFLGSGRRSADIDLDYLGNSFDAFRDRVTGMLTGPAIPRILAARDVRLFDVRLRQDTSTTKRWMLKLARPGMPDATSKVEFSRRGHGLAPVLEQADAELARALGGVAARLQHYPAEAAIAQKVDALIERRRTEPRDVFDLDHLLRRYQQAFAAAILDPDRLLTAAKVAEDIDYADYQHLVEPYLDEDIVGLYRGEEAWLDMRIRVVTLLRERAGASP